MVLAAVIHVTRTSDQIAKDMGGGGEQYLPILKARFFYNHCRTVLPFVKESSYRLFRHDYSLGTIYKS